MRTEPRIERARPLLGTSVAIGVTGLTERDAHCAIDRGFAAIAAIGRLMSFHDAGSDVSALNRAAWRGEIRIDPQTHAVLRHAREFSAASAGTFDVTVAARLVAAGFLPRPVDAPLPDPAASWRDIELRAHDRVRFRRPLWIDLGGIAKGYAVDAALAAMALAPDVGVRVNAGGDLRVAGRAPTLVRLRVPGHDQAAPCVRLHEASLASSSVGEADGPLGSPPGSRHVDGHRRRFLDAGRFVSVIAQECVVADALTKIVLARGARAALLLRRLDATAFVHDRGRGWRTIGRGA